MIQKRKPKAMQAIGTSSLPDIVFMLIIFFMVTSTIRETNKKVIVKIPEASETAKLERKDLASHIYVGTPIKTEQARYGTDVRIQLNDSFRSVTDIRDFVAAERENMNEADRPFMTVSIRADINTRMGIITDIKQELRRCSALKIMYSSRKPSTTE